jgi:ubiquitin-conjugating enzyme E2 variant
MLVLLQVLAGALVADAASGLIHWFEDTYLPYCTTTPFLSTVARDNELHHYFPREITHFGDLQNTVITFPLALACVCMATWWWPRGVVKTHRGFWLSFLVFASLANVFHKYAHLRDCEKPGAVRFLQEHGLAISSEEHRAHHLRPDHKYCTITPWVNPVLDGLGVFRFLEGAIGALTGVRPSPKKGYGDYAGLQTALHRAGEIAASCPRRPTALDLEYLRGRLAAFYNC